MYNIKYYIDYVERLFAEENFMGAPKELYVPIEYTLRLGGKRIRPTLLLAANALFDGKEEEAAGAALGIEIFHNFTLLHDDLMDRSPLRRGQPTVYVKWDENTAVLSGDTMYALAWRYMLRTPGSSLREVLTCFNESAIEVCEGQQKDMNFERLSLQEVSIADYMEMIRQKTAVLLAGALKIGALVANAPAADVERLYAFGIHLGLAFQLQDDLLDGYGDTAVFGKKTGQDIRDNKKSYLPLLALQMADADQAMKLVDLFDPTRSCDEEAKVSEVMAIYDALGLRGEVEKAIFEQFTMAQALLDDVVSDEANKTPIRELVDTLACRKK